MNTENDSDLVKAAKNEVRAALDIYNEAFKIAQNDPRMLQQLQQINPLLQQANKRVIEAAKLASRYPDNPQYKNDLQQAQKELIGVVQRITNLTAPQISNENFVELETTTREVFTQNNLQSQGLNNVMGLADNVMKKMEQLLGSNLMNMSVEEMMKNTNLLTKEVKDVSNALKEMAKNVTNPQLKQALLSGAAILQDNAMKLKILAAVKGSQGDQGDNSVQSAIMVMKNELGSIMNNISSLNLKHSVKNTEKQAEILKKIANQVRRERRNH